MLNTAMKAMKIDITVIPATGSMRSVPAGPRRSTLILMMHSTA
jgi:hypothetical protein